MEAFNRFKDKAFFCVNFACGLGKTLVASVISRHKQMPTIIIAPNALCEQWRDELIELGVDPTDIFIASTPEENRDKDAYAAKFAQWIKG
jgi:superfamily II DNA or RNA helicase